MNAYADFENYLPVQTLSAFELSRDARDMCFGLVCVDHMSCHRYAMSSEVPTFFCKPEIDHGKE